MKPTFFVAGPPKCASSSLYFYLGQHPEIQMSVRKETRFFSNEYALGLDHYLETQFPDRPGVKAAGEATPSYAFLRFAAERIALHFPQAHIIFSFRDPAERAFSGWLMRKENGSEKLDFADAIRANREQGLNFDDPNFEQAWVKEHLEGSHKPGDIIRTYLEGGDYLRVLDVYQSLFPPEQIHWVLTEDLRKDLLGNLRQIYQWIGVDESFVIPIQSERNTYRKARFSWLLYAVNHPRSKALLRALPKPVRTRLAGSLTREDVKPKMSPEDRALLVAHYRPMIEALETRLGRDLSAWKRV